MINDVYLIFEVYCRIERRCFLDDCNVCLASEYFETLFNNTKVKESSLTSAVVYIYPDLSAETRIEKSNRLVKKKNLGIEKSMVEEVDGLER